jgi:Family of unknown function (DUF5677)
LSYSSCIIDPVNEHKTVGFGVVLMAGAFGEQLDRPQPHTPGGIVNVSARLAAELPWFWLMCAWSWDQVMALTRDFLKSKDSKATAEAIIFNQAVNDWFDLIYELGEGSGRPATRSARALVEHAINLSDISANPSLSAQYIDHLAVADLRLRDAAIGISRLTGNEQKSARRRLRQRAGKAEPVVTNGRRKYHKRWRSQWHQDSLKDRADAHGLASLYDYYAIASLVQHGAAGGSIGTRNTIVGEIVHRTGPAFALCPGFLPRGHPRLQGFDRRSQPNPARAGLDRRPCCDRRVADRISALPRGHTEDRQHDLAYDATDAPGPHPGGRSKRQTTMVYP